jgi:hypothetical protein
MARVKIVAGSIELSIDGIDYTRRQVTALLAQVAALAAAMNAEPDEEPTPNPVGFTAHLERAPESFDASLPYEDED